MNYAIRNVANVLKTIQQMGCDLNVIEKNLNKNRWKNR